MKKLSDDQQKTIRALHLNIKLVNLGYYPISDNMNDYNLPYFMQHGESGRVICLDHTELNYRPMGKLETKEF